MITIYRAKRILTMNPSRPTASHVAVQDGYVMGAGELDELTGWGEHTLAHRRARTITVVLLVANLVLLNAWLYPVGILRVDLTEKVVLLR